ncbi:hypothetical protein L3X38_035694 [Prunus dulcis]|uniref:Uncharacterized protein n=1 Tax=Prunus dulcis TaxID=3755 RepID=A0AAD4YZ25_PRUDU|nr:hypothetical protein L3X38_035694 [Prunus dulcis]
MSQKGYHYWTIIKEWPNAYSISNPGHAAESRVKRQLSKQRSDGASYTPWQLAQDVMWIDRGTDSGSSISLRISETRS